MKTRVFKCGNSLAVRLPKGLIEEGKEVDIFKRNDEIVVREVPRSLAGAFELLCDLPDDFFQGGRQDEKPQERDEL